MFCDTRNTLLDSLNAAVCSHAKTALELSAATLTQSDKDVQSKLQAKVDAARVTLMAAHGALDEHRATHGC